MMHLSNIACFYNQAHFCASFLANEVMMDSRSKKQRRNRCMVCVPIAIREDNYPGAIGNRDGYLASDLFNTLTQGGSTTCNRKESANPMRCEPWQVTISVHMDNLGQLIVINDRKWQDDLSTRCRAGVKKIVFRANSPGK
ncbi:unannotated protein [freshwater metagenome]|uniref:Unannotated protein n=1 Tax=freshwater metagenome TaxID=449393 RepID=A0A6J6QZF1_9ZZZZ